MNTTGNIATDLTRGSVARQLLAFSWPIMLSNLFQTVYSLVDMVVVGRFVGATGLSAVGIGGQVMTLFLSIGMSVGHAGQILISQQVGARDREGLGWTIYTIVSVEGLASLAAGVLCILGCDWVLSVMNTPPEALEAARSYTLVCGFGMLFVYGYNAVSSILRGLGESRLPMIAIFVAQIINIILDLVFVAGFGRGAGGAALATVIGQAVSLCMTVLYLYKKRSFLGFTIERKHLQLRRRNLAALAKLGLPLLAQELLITLSMTYINAMVNVFGITASAVDAVGSKLNSILYIAIDGMAVGASAMIGQSFGARDFNRIRSIHRHALLFSGTVSVVLSVVLVCFSQPVFSLFTSDAAVIAMAPHYIWVVVVYSFAAASMVGSFSVVEGIGYASFAMIASLADGVVARIGLGWLTGRMFGLYGFWFGSACAGFVTTLITGTYYLSGRWKKRQPLLEAESGD